MRISEKTVRGGGVGAFVAAPVARLGCSEVAEGVLRAAVSRARVARCGAANGICGSDATIAPMITRQVASEIKHPQAINQPVAKIAQYCEFPLKWPLF